MTASRDDLLDAAALVKAAAYSHIDAIEVLLDHGDNRGVAEILARWCAGWLLDAAALSQRDQKWWFTELRSWAEHSDGTGWPWQVLCTSTSNFDRFFEHSPRDPASVLPKLPQHARGVPPK